MAHLVLVLGASGIVGQHLRLAQPENVSVVYTATRQAMPRDAVVALRAPDDLDAMLAAWDPAVIINLAGENRPDVVERDPGEHLRINTIVPIRLARWAHEADRRLIHVSTQGVLDGLRPPYAASDPAGEPVNAYGRQKREAELVVCRLGGVVARLTFLLGIRPFPHIGRPNPAEQMLEAATRGQRTRQVHDRRFSVSFAADAAEVLWALAVGPREAGIVHVGTPGSTSRFQLAHKFALSVGGDLELIEPAEHDVAFPAPAWAQRPFDTTYTLGARHRLNVDRGIEQVVRDWRRRLDYFDVQDRAIEVAGFLGRAVDPVVARIQEGFGPNHAKVAQSFREAHPESDADLLRWYRQTDAYIWELTAYHLDRGFNYHGMCEGIIKRLATTGHPRVLCLGDGIGDLTILARAAGLSPTYHDLLGSQTSAFASFRIARRQFDPPPEFLLTGGWTPDFEGREFDAVVALDFFEHLVNVEAWARAVYAALRPGGVFLAQNAFGIGSPDREGSIPCHLAINTHFEHDWDPLLRTIGFTLEPDSGWWVRP